MWYLIIAILLLLIIWRSIYKNERAKASFASIDLAEKWLLSESIEPSSVKFSCYSDPLLMKNFGASAIVGSGYKNDGSLVSFILEVTAESGVVESAYIEPFGIATYHRKASEIAEKNGITLIEAITSMAQKHRENELN